ncbi:hypothetical protein ACJ9N4_20510 [Enterobacter sp. LM3]|uniref:hypothetical protein n=1 Tax=Enterobacter sp. LM3 TaxID=3384450 RepID=UPI003986C413
MKELLENYTRVAQASSGAFALSLMESLVLVIFSRKLYSGHLVGIDLVYVWFLLGLTTIALVFSVCSIWQTIENETSNIKTKAVMIFLYFPVYFGVIFSGLITGGIILKY